VAIENVIGVSDASHHGTPHSAPAIDVLIANETDAQVDGDRLEAAVALAIDGSAYLNGSVSVAIVDDETIHRLNRQFLQHDYATDVLSFTLEGQPPRLEGEIIVSLDTAARCAAEVGWPPDDELLLYVVHGALHLAGHRDKQPAAAAAMRAREAEILDSLGVRRSLRDSRWSAAADGDQEACAP
jgi:probable rRNA maturation factor